MLGKCQKFEKIYVNSDDDMQKKKFGKMHKFWLRSRSFWWGYGLDYITANFKTDEHALFSSL